MGYYAFGNFWACQKKITIYSLFGSPCNADDYYGQVVVIRFLDDSPKDTMVILAILRRLVIATTCQQGTGGRPERFLKRLFASSFQNPFQPCLQPW